MLRVEPRSPTYGNARFGDTPVVDAVATQDDETGQLVVMAVNRSIDESVLSVALRAFPTIGWSSI